MKTMKPLIVPFFVVAASVLLLVGCRTVHTAASTAPVRWEYKTVTREDMRNKGFERLPDDVLNKLGDEGWLLVLKDEAGRYFFKRPK